MLPGQADATRAVELLGQPRRRSVVLLGSLVHGVQQQIGVEEHQRAAGPSRVSIASAMLETSIPRATAGVLGLDSPPALPPT